MNASFHVGSLVVAAILLGLAAGTSASARQGVLTTIEGTRLVQIAQPADHARLRDHSSALADRYAAEARNHTAMARAFLMNPGRRVAAHRSSEHCARLATLAAESADTVRELAAHHGRLAAGLESTSPCKGARFEAGEGAEVVWAHDKAIHDLAANARTVSDHRSIEKHFVEIEQHYNREVNEHLAMAQAYRGVPNRRGGDQAAREAGTLAAEHRRAAEAAR